MVRGSRGCNGEVGMDSGALASLRYGAQELGFRRGIGNILVSSHVMLEKDYNKHLDGLRRS